LALDLREKSIGEYVAFADHIVPLEQFISAEKLLCFLE